MFLCVKAAGCPMKNKDKNVPKSIVQASEVVIEKFIPAKPIFWGPNQLTVYPDTYNEPRDWRDKEFINIPRVARFFFGDGGEAAGGGACDGSDGRPPDSCWLCIEIISPGLDEFNPPFNNDRRWINLAGQEVYERPSRINVDEGRTTSVLDREGNYTYPGDPNAVGLGGDCDDNPPVPPIE